MKTRFAVFASGLVSLAFMLTAGPGCTARRGETVRREPQVDAPAEKRGEVVFMKNCHRCHPNGEAGLGPSLNEKPLPGFAMRFQIHNGIGAMPSFSNKEIDEDEMDDLIEYLKTLRTGE